MWIKQVKKNDKLLNGKNGLTTEEKEALALAIEFVDTCSTINENGVSNIENKRLTQEQINSFLDAAATINCDIGGIIDRIEQCCKDGFTNQLNSGVSETSQEFKSNPSRLKVFNGQKFNIVMHSASNPEEFIDNLDSSKGSSFTVIDDKHIRCWKPKKNKICILFST